MSTETERGAPSIGPEVPLVEEVPMVRQERWEELRRLWQHERISMAELARRFELDRKTVRRCLREPAWRPYQRSAPAETVLSRHAEYLRDRAPKVRYSARILFQELRQQGYQGSYETVKRFVRPLRAAQLLDDAPLTRFETPETAGRRSRGRPFKPGQSGNPGGRPKGSKTYAIRELVAQALTDPDTREAAIAEFRRALTRSKTVIIVLGSAAGRLVADGAAAAGGRLACGAYRSNGQEYVGSGGADELRPAAWRPVEPLAQRGICWR